MADDHPVSVALENRLMSHGIYLTEFGQIAAEDDGTASGEGGDAASDETEGERRTERTPAALEYEVVSEAETVTSAEVGAVVRTVLAISDEREWNPGRLEVTSRTTDGAVRGRWHVEREWFERLPADLTDVEFSRRVLETVTLDSERT
ncbi:hypothetical protein [Natrarchaeobius oligotrophus]|uniref:DUF8159 domain-containing protein n=1 Tax=Natrarchaeobius chitinivorans TaxID=1679083 RepID=A0A3N6MP25_NATCH|nr:hypothetical protein [Natrarchaeobius chitinivorans]RQG96256.1 hypothetical protein EA472_20595 [Natrarchaeobius chitinivorans]